MSGVFSCFPDLKKNSWFHENHRIGRVKCREWQVVMDTEFNVFAFRCFGRLLMLGAFQQIKKTITLLLIRRSASSPE
ncbi:MAG TPA: hypothetical protein DD706_16070 [Nitrospiraceae bacterium]|nr:hypothetical protein [Nitrospiraceae bacterium]